MAEITLEQVEKLRSRSSLSYEEARALLEQCGGSVLDALIELERQGRATGPNGGANVQPPFGKPTGPSKPRATPVTMVSGSTWENFWKDLWMLLGHCWEILKHCNLYHLHIFREGKLISAIPIWVVLVLVLVAFYITLPLAAVGLMMGCRYDVVKEG